MNIYVSKATAKGPTALAAFDDCLLQNGVGNQNLIYLSSIIPPGSKIVVGKPEFDDSHWGNKLYTVMAQQRETIRHRQAWAGIGWVMDTKNDRGLFVEHEGHSEDEVQQDIAKSLTNMMEKRPRGEWTEIQMQLAGTICGDDPVCAMVVAVFQSQPWD